MTTIYKFFILFAILFATVCSVNAQNLQEVVYLKNGSIIRGTIIEQVPNESLKVQTSDGSVFVYKMEEVAKITKEPKYNASNGSSNADSDEDERYGWEKAPRYRGFIGESYIFGQGDVKEERNYLWTSHGCQILPYLYAGVGVGANYWVDSELWSVPVFAHFRSEIHKVFRKNVSPYFDAKIGYSFADCEGFYFAPQVGCHFYFGHSVTGISVGIGYTIQNYKFGNRYYSSKNLDAGGLELTLAFDF